MGSRYSGVANRLALMRLRVGLVLVALYAICLSSAIGADWKEEWEKTITDAKREATVVAYTFPGQERLFQEFQKKFPELKFVDVIVRGSERVTRILSERRAGKF